MEVQGAVIDKKSTLNSEAVSNRGYNLDRPFGGVVGSNNCCRSGGNEVIVGNIYRHDISLSSSSSSSLISFNNNSNMSATRRSSDLQAFEIFPSVSVPAGYSPFKSPGGGMASSVGFPFTSAQWKELQRQAMVYKCMISSVPVPSDLLFPLPNSTTPLYNGRYSKNGDPEPGRCKRTDGKKWRCSRDVAPHQKYCERHLHRGRPRSRKPVEAVKTINNAEINKKTRVEQQIHLPTNSSANVVAQQFGTGQPDHQQSRLFFNPETDIKISASAPFKGTNHREMDLMLEGEMVAMNVPEQQWKNFIGENMGYSNESSIYTSSAPMYHRDYMDAFSYSSTFPTPEIENPTGYIDAWSLDNFNCNNNTNVESSISPNNGNLSPSLTLSMAMAAGNALDEEMGKIHDIKDSTHHKNKDWKWSNPVPWEPFSRSGPGGPLAEALHPGSVPASPYDSHLATAVSSPSGVLHRTLFSNSDGSVCNSPTLAAAPPSEIAFQWLN